MIAFTCGILSGISSLANPIMTSGGLSLGITCNRNINCFIYDMDSIISISAVLNQVYCDYVNCIFGIHIQLLSFNTIIHNYEQVYAVENLPNNNDYMNEFSHQFTCVLLMIVNVVY